MLSVLGGTHPGNTPDASEHRAWMEPDGMCRLLTLTAEHFPLWKLEPLPAPRGPAAEEAGGAGRPWGTCSRLSFLLSEAQVFQSGHSQVHPQLRAQPLAQAAFHTEKGAPHPILPTFSTHTSLVPIREKAGDFIHGCRQTQQFNVSRCAHATGCSADPSVPEVGGQSGFSGSAPVQHPWCGRARWLAH